MTNAAIAKATTKTEKIIENTVSRAALAFSIKTSKDINVRVLRIKLTKLLGIFQLEQ